MRHLTPSNRLAASAALALGGVGVFALGFGRPPGPAAWIGLGAVGVAVAVPASRRAAGRAGLSFSRWGRRHPVVLATLAGVVSALVLLALGLVQGREPGLKWHDEFAYATHAQMMAQGRLWMPAHPLGDFFASFYMVTDPVYVPIYFPGTALAHVPGAALGVPPWITSLGLSGLAAGLLCWIATRWHGPVAGVLASLLLVSVVWFRLLSLMILSQTVVLVLALGMLAAWTAWRHRRAWPLELTLGLLAGWLAVTRPVDAVAIVAPVAVAAAWSAVRRGGASGLGRLIALVVLGAAPFLAMQGAINHATTGTVSGYPHAAWVTQNYPDAGYGFGPITDRPSRSAVPQVRRFYEREVVPKVRRHRETAPLALLWNERLPVTVYAWMPSPWFIGLMLAGVLVARPLAAVSVASLSLFLLLYGPSCFYQWYYPLAVGYASLLLTVGGVCVTLPRLLGLRRRHRWAPAAAVAGLAVAVWPGVNPEVRDEPVPFPELMALDDWQAHDARAPALAFFRDGEGETDAEPVYNPSVAWPDEAPVVRLHDRGARNLDALAYYAQIQPERRVYLIDRGSGRRFDLGLVTDAYHSLRDAIETQRRADPAPRPASPVPSAEPADAPR